MGLVSMLQVVVWFCLLSIRNLIYNSTYVKQFLLFVLILSEIFLGSIYRGLRPRSPAQGTFVPWESLLANATLWHWRTFIIRDVGAAIGRPQRLTFYARLPPCAGAPPLLPRPRDVCPLGIPLYSFHIWHGRAYSGIAALGVDPEGEGVNPMMQANKKSPLHERTLCRGGSTSTPPSKGRPSLGDPAM